MTDSVQPLSAAELDALDGDVGVRKTFRADAEHRDIVCPAEQWDRLIATCRASIEDRERLDWLEANSRIHAEPEEAQVVVRHHEADPRLGNEEAGFYVVRWGDLVVYEGGGADRNYRKTYHGDSLRAALDAARRVSVARSGRGPSSGGEHG